MSRSIPILGAGASGPGRGLIPGCRDVEGPEHPGVPSRRVCPWAGSRSRSPGLARGGRAGGRRCLLLVVWRPAAVRLRALPRRRRLARAVVRVPLAPRAARRHRPVADAVNAHFGYLPRLGDVVGLAVGAAGAWPTVSAADLADPRHRARRPDGAVLTLHLPDQGSGFGPSRGAGLPPAAVPRRAPRAVPRRLPAARLAGGAGRLAARRGRGRRRTGAGARGSSRHRGHAGGEPGWLDDPECVDGVEGSAESHFVDDVVPGWTRCCAPWPTATTGSSPG